jgi:hypothetical protein
VRVRAPRAIIHLALAALTPRLGAPDLPPGGSTVLPSAIVFAVLVAATPTEPVTFLPPAETEAALVVQLADAAKALVAALPADELAASTFPFAGPEHRFWHWIPAPLLADKTLAKNFAPYGRRGVPVEKMSDQAVERLHRLLRVALSAQGYRKVEQVIHREGGDEPRFGFHGIGRTPAGNPPGGPGWYFFTLFGAVGDQPWGWRIEGHHLSLTYEIAGGHVRFSPLAVGHNPSPVPPEASAWAVRLFESLSPELQKQAQVVATATDPRIPEDMDHSPGRPELVGPALGQLSADGQWAYDQLVEDFVGNFPEVLVHDLRKRLHAQSAEAHLAWYGLLDDAHPHYYRLQGPSFLIQVRHQGLDHGYPHVHTSYRSLDDGSVASGAAAP